MVWLEIAKNYKTRCVNEVFRIYYVDDDQTGATLSKKKALNENAPGRMHYYIWMLNNDLEYFFHSPMPFLKAAVMLPVVSWASGQRLGATLKALHSTQARFLLISALPLSGFLSFFARA